MSVIDTRTGKILIRNKTLIKEAKKWLASKTNRQLIKELKELEEKLNA